MKKIYGEDYLKPGDEIYEINLDEEIVILDGERLTEDRAYKLGQELAIKLREIYDREENDAKPLWLPNSLLRYLPKPRIGISP